MNFLSLNRCHVVVDQSGHHRLHRVFRHPPRDGRPRVQDPVTHPRQHRHLATSSLKAHVQRAVQQSHGGLRGLQAQPQQHHVSASRF